MMKDPQVGFMAQRNWQFWMTRSESFDKSYQCWYSKYCRSRLVRQTQSVTILILAASVNYGSLCDHTRYHVAVQLYIRLFAQVSTITCLIAVHISQACHIMFTEQCLIAVDVS